MAYDSNLREEEVKNKLRADYFKDYDSTPILGNIDFAVAVPIDGAQLFETEYLLWAESKKGTQADIYESFVQLILTIGKARTFDHHLPPAFLGAFDAEKIAFIHYNTVIDIFYQNDFNWKVTPSDHTTKEFRQIFDTVKDTLTLNVLIYHFDSDDKELRRFIRQNFVIGKSRLSKIRINKNNFTAIYQKWLKEVKPTIGVNWEKAKSNGIIDADFYLADILSEHNVTLKEKLFVLLRQDHYELDRRFDEMGLFDSKKAQFNDKQEAHHKFWNRYNRPPKREYWDYIASRRDLLVPQDVRERKGSFFTPRCWVELSQEYIAAELGEDWQDEYYVWDCAAGTGNLLAGLTNKYNIWASTLDQADVDVMHDRIRNGANLLDSHVFQFDFLNDPFTKLPQPLQDIIADEEKRRKLVIYINPPYAEAGDSKQLTGKGKNKTDVAVKHYTYSKYIDKIGIAGRELFAQFLIRIYHEIPSCVLANFSTLKNLQAPNFLDFRTNFRAKLGRIFIVPADSFDNVKGQFPIGFFIWDTAVSAPFQSVNSDVYDANGNYIGTKTLLNYDTEKNIGFWVNQQRDDNNPQQLGFMSNGRNDFQNQKLVYFMNQKSQMPTPRGWWITPNNLIRMSIFVAVRHCIAASWLNDRDQFLFPNDGWQNDMEFQNDCLAYMLFHNSNTIQSSFGPNHWIPFTEAEVDAKEKFDSHFMSDYISGKHRPISATTPDLFAQPEAAAPATEPLTFSPEAQDVMDAGRELWRYYHAQPEANPNASYYDIRLHFQGTKVMKSGKAQMNPDSTDEHYTQLIKALRERLKALAEKIEPKVYEYGFLKR